MAMTRCWPGVSICSRTPTDPTASVATTTGNASSAKHFAVASQFFDTVLRTWMSPRLLFSRRERETRLAGLRGIINQRKFRLVRRRDKVPIVLMGDFNSPSHQDELVRTRRAEKSTCRRRRKFRWPVTVELAAEGFVDAFRSVHSSRTSGADSTPLPMYVSLLIFHYILLPPSSFSVPLVQCF